MSIVAFLFFEGFGNVGQGACLDWHLHHRHGGERGVAAIGTDGAPVRAPGVGVAVGEVDTFLGETVQIGGDVRPSADLRKLTATTLHQDDNDIGGACIQ